MARSRGTTISVKIPVNWRVMSFRGKMRLRQIVGRDSRIIRAYIGVIEAHEDDLLQGVTGLKIDEGTLNEKTLTALKVAAGAETRESVLHDFKRRFPRISTTDMVECRQTAVSLYESYLVLQRKKHWNASRPGRTNLSGRIPRWVFMPYRAALVEHKTCVARWWLDLRDSMDSAVEGRRRHDRLRIPLKMSAFHLNQLARGEPKAVQVFKDYRGKWWVTIAIRLEAINEDDSGDRPLAVLGIDLGVKKSACTTLLTGEKVSETRYFSNDGKEERIERYDNLIADLQRELDCRKSQSKNTATLPKRLKTLRRKRRCIAEEHDRLFVSSLMEYIEELSLRYTLFVALGQVKGIRWRARRGRRSGKKFRRMIHRWSFARISEMLKHRLAQLGWPVDSRDSRFYPVHEAWSSIRCWKCGSRGYRPRQSLFVCSCGFKTNADRNGSLNIARRLITLIPVLKDEKHGLGRWATPERAPAPKAGRKQSSERKPSLSNRNGISYSGESAAVHSVQMDLLSFGDKAGLSDDDHAVVRTVETLTVATADTGRSRQEKEARSRGGIPSR